jgi:hypothetical protein
MTISTLVKLLQEQQELHGDIPVCTYNHSGGMDYIEEIDFKDVELYQNQEFYNTSDHRTKANFLMI